MTITLNATDGIATPPVSVLGSTSGSITFTAPAVAGTNTQTLVAATGTLAPRIAGTVQASTSGTSIDFTGIPSWVKRITVMFDGVSLSGTDSFLIQLGDSGGLEATGYNGGGARFTASAVAATAFTTGFSFNNATAGTLYSGSVTITNVTGNTWAASGTLGGSATEFACVLGGAKTLTAALDRVGVTRTGTDTFDAGSINILYE
jgi:hypothetical protein